MIERLTDTVFDVWSGLRSHPGRTLLSFLGIAVGTASLTILLNVISGLSQKAQRMEQDFGINVFCITGKPDTDENPPDITPQHVAILRSNLTNCLVSPVTKHLISGNGSIPEFQLVVTDMNLATVRSWPVIAGRFIDRIDEKEHRRVCVLSKQLAHETNLSPGDTLSIQTLPFQVIGVIDNATGTGMDIQQNTTDAANRAAVYIPKSAPPFWDDSYRPPEAYYDAVFVMTTPDSYPIQASLLAKRLLQQPKFKLNNAVWITPDQVTAEIRKWQRLIEWVAGGISLLCLTMGGMTLMSLMVSNITTRIPEIGLRISLGATRFQIVSLFLSETAVITLLAATAGALTANLMLMAGHSRIPLTLDAWTTSSATAIAVTLILGALFSIWPAITASRISPAAALRND